jgi:hypothetical protein
MHRIEPSEAANANDAAAERGLECDIRHSGPPDPGNPHRRDGPHLIMGHTIEHHQHRPAPGRGATQPASSDKTGLGRQELAEFAALKKWLLHQAFTGEL